MNAKTILKNSVIFLLFLVPLFPLIPLPTGWWPFSFSNQLFFPFITGKAYVFRILVELAFFLWIALAYRDRQYAPKWNWMTVLVTVFALATLVADLFGMNPIRSLWSNNERMEGWLEIIHLWAYFIVLTSMFKESKWWPRYFNMSIIVAVAISIYGICQMLGWTEIHQSAARLDASLGNSAYLAVYMLIHAFLAMYLAAVAWREKNTTKLYIYSALSVLFTFILFETQTRGSQLGIVGGIFLTLVLYAVWPRQVQGEVRTARGRSIAGGIAVLLVLLGIGFYFGRNVSWIKNNDAVGRLASISLSDTTTISRLKYIWPNAIRGAFSSPKTAVIGWGQENFNYIFNASYDPHMWQDEQWFDRAHNVFLDWLVDGGIVAFLLYISFYLLSLWFIWKSELTVAERSILTGLLAGYAVHNIFVFDNLSSYYLFFLFLAFVFSLRPSRDCPLWQKFSADEEKANYVILPFAVVLFAVTLYFINVRPISANLDLIAALENCSGQEGIPSTAPWQKALAVNTYVANQEIREQLLTCSDAVISSQQVDGNTKLAFLNLTNTEVRKQIAATPKDARIYVLAGGFYNDIQQWSLAAPLLEKAHQLTPGKQQVNFELGLNYLNTNKKAEGLALFEQAYAEDPTYPDANINYAAALIATGHEASSTPILAGNTAWQTDQRIINAYAAAKEYTKVISIYKTLISQNPSNVQYRVSLAASYYQSGDKYDATATIKQAIKDFPLYKDQLTQVLQEIQAPTPTVNG
ncbi:MAG: O-antigen ligase family protein [Patescibacteria group bacterium]|nr:O-antigen ligase family protein [Patescibacteria group bacterium]